MFANWCTGVVQIPPLVQVVGPSVACRQVGAGRVKHDAQVGQVEHGQQPEQQVDGVGVRGRSDEAEYLI